MCRRGGGDVVRRVMTEKVMYRWCAGGGGQQQRCAAVCVGHPARRPCGHMSAGRRCPPLVGVPAHVVTLLILMLFLPACSSMICTLGVVSSLTA